MNFKSVALLAAKRAGKVLLNYYGKNEKVTQKSNKTYVSAADLNANKAVISAIKKYFPNHNILSEETVFEDNKSEYTWVIDPLDGTHNFLHQIPIFGTSIALKHKNEVILGVLHLPILKLTAIAEKNKGAFLNGKKLKVSSHKSLDYAFITFAYSNESKIENIKFLKKLSSYTIDIRNFGAAVYGLMLVASGRSDASIILSTYPWDVAAGFLIVEEAGGKVTDLKGGKWDLSQNKFIVSNGKIHKKLLNCFK